MMWQAGYNIDNMEFEPTFFGYFYRKKLIGVNSGHLCMLDRDDTKGKHYRSRGLWVDPKHRGKGIGQKLLTAAVEQGKDLGCNMVWSYPRKTSWSTYKAVGFKLDTKWIKTENGSNAYCSLNTESW